MNQNGQEIVLMPTDVPEFFLDENPLGAQRFLRVVEATVQLIGTKVPVLLAHAPISIMSLKVAPFAQFWAISSRAGTGGTKTASLVRFFSIHFILQKLYRRRRVPT